MRDRVLRAKEVSEILGVSRQMIYRYMRDSITPLPYRRLPSGGIRILESELWDWMKSLGRRKLGASAFFTIEPGSRRDSRQ